MGKVAVRPDQLENEVRRYLEWKGTPVDKRRDGHHERGFEILEVIWANLDRLRSSKQGLKLDFESSEEVRVFLNQAHGESTHSEIEITSQELADRLKAPRVLAIHICHAGVRDISRPISTVDTGRQIVVSP